MERLVKKCGSNSAVPTGFDLDFIFDLCDKEYKGLQAVFDRLCELEDKIERGELEEVVRCKDCSKISPSVTPIKNAVWCREFRAYMPCDGFCSYGERREGE